MNSTRFDQSLQLLAGSSGRRDAVRSLGTIGTVLLAALVFAPMASADQRRTDSGQGGADHKNRGRDRHRNRNRNRSGDHRQNRGAASQHGPRENADDETPGGAAGGDGLAGPDGVDRQPLEQNGMVQAERKRPTKRGPTGPTGPAGSTLATRLVSSPLSNPLPVTTGVLALAFADCGGEGKVVACGHSIVATAAQLANTIVVDVVATDDRDGCIVNLARTTNVGSTAGAQIIAEAICLD